jgi:hypothetical protein
MKLFRRSVLFFTIKVTEIDCMNIKEAFIFALNWFRRMNVIVLTRWFIFDYDSILFVPSHSFCDF